MKKRWLVLVAGAAMLAVLLLVFSRVWLAWFGTPGVGIDTEDSALLLDSPSITIIAELDGMQDVLISHDGLKWRNRTFDPPQSVVINGKEWRPSKSPDYLGAVVLPKDLSGVQLRVRKAAGQVRLMYVGTDRVIVRMDDSFPRGANLYDFDLVFGPPPISRSEADAERKAAETTLRYGGYVTLDPQGKVQELSRLPAGPFFVRGIVINDNQYVDDQAVTSLIGGVQGLQELRLTLSTVSTVGLAEIGKVRSLRVLDLADALRITDADLGGLEGLSDLTWLSLQGTAVTDQGLTALSRLRKLQTLVLTGTAVSEEGLAALRRELPECEIIR